MGDLPTPTECGFCHENAPDFVGHIVTRRGAKHTGAICRECVRTFMLVMADTAPEQFEEFVAEAKAK